MKKLKVKLWDTVRMKMMGPQAITFDSKSLTPFAVKVSGRSWDPVGKYEIIQWTGLVDENGEDVFEGDFVKFSSELYIVEWNEALARFELVSALGSNKRSIADVANGYIKGNKYENMAS